MRRKFRTGRLLVSKEVFCRVNGVVIRKQIDIQLMRQATIESSKRTLDQLQVVGDLLKDGEDWENQAEGASEFQLAAGFSAEAALWLVPCAALPRSEQQIGGRCTLIRWLEGVASCSDRMEGHGRVQMPSKDKDRAQTLFGLVCFNIPVVQHRNFCY